MWFWLMKAITLRPTALSTAGRPRPGRLSAMPYLRCPRCGLLAHVLATAHTEEVHCPRCCAHEQQIRLTPLEESLRHIYTPPREHPEAAR
jgi:phage FluMu protein Com